MKNYKNEVKKSIFLYLSYGKDGKSKMEIYQGAFFIITVLGIVMFVIAVKTNSSLILDFVIRSVSGCLLIFVINQWVEIEGYSWSVGLNPGTVLTSGILGIPGVILLFSIKIYSLL